MATIGEWAQAMGLFDNQLAAGRSLRQNWLDRQAAGTAADIYSQMQSAPQAAPYQPQVGAPASYASQLGLSAPAPVAQDGYQGSQASGGRGRAWAMNDRAREARDFFVAQGYAPHQAAGIVGNLMQESSLNVGARNRGDGRDGSDSVGIGQWNGGRARALAAFAAQRGMPIDDFHTQLAFVDNELKNGEGAAYRGLMASQNVDDATAAMIGYERPSGWTSNNPRGGHGWDNRLRYAQGLLGGPEGAAAHAVNRASPQALAYAGADPAVDRTTEAQKALAAVSGIAGPSVGGIPINEPPPSSAQPQIVQTQLQQTPAQSQFAQAGGGALPGYSPQQIPAVPTVASTQPKITRDQFERLYRSQDTRPLALALWKAQVTGSREDAQAAQELALKLDQQSYSRAVGERSFATGREDEMYNRGRQERQDALSNRRLDIQDQRYQQQVERQNRQDDLAERRYSLAEQRAEGQGYNIRTVKNPDGSETLYRIAPDGSATPVQVGGATGSAASPTNPYATGKFNEGQGKAANFADRMATSGVIIDQNEGINEGFGGAVGGLAQNVLPSGAFNMVASDDRQKVVQAQRDFINAILRRESGAAISSGEFDNAAKQYFPQPGDRPETLRQKRENRRIATEGLMREAGPSYRPPQGWSGPQSRSGVTPPASGGNTTSTGARWRVIQ